MNLDKSHQPDCIYTKLDSNLFNSLLQNIEPWIVENPKGPKVRGNIDIDFPFNEQLSSDSATIYFIATVLLAPFCFPYCSFPRTENANQIFMHSYRPK